MTDDFYEYKRRKEAFVSNHDGTSILEVTWLICCGMILLGNIAIYGHVFQRYFSPFGRYVIEFLFGVFPVLLSFTLTNWSYILVLISALFLASKCALSSEFKPTLDERVTTQYEISFYRSLLLLLTCICILAVDFQVFPRRFAKTETYGTSLMDSGVGGFVLSNAFVTKVEALRNRSYLSILRDTIPILILGLLRLVTTKGVEYQEHVSEYGVHWNFFFTLAFVGLGSKLILSLPILHNPLHIGIALGVLYQLLLSTCGLEDWVLRSPRFNLISQNKEGIASLLGYLSLFCIGIWMGTFHQTRKLTSKELRFRWFISASLLVLASCFDAYGPPISRRLANGPYVIWILGVGELILAGTSTLVFLASGSLSSLIIDSMNSNQLFLFLFANILTGLCNVSIRTLDRSDFDAILILTCYIGVVTGAAVWLFTRQIRLNPRTLFRKS